MKKTTLRQAALKLALLAFVLLSPLGLRAQETLTVHNGATTNSVIPAYILYFDDFARSQYVIPATELEEMSGGTINAIKFYTTSQNIPYTTVSTVDVYLMEVDYTNMTALEPKANGTIVYQGYLNVVSEGTGGSLTITFSTPYTYGGGNLLVGIENTTDVNYKSIYFYGESVSGASWGGSNGSSLSGVTGSQRNFIPQTTFEYEPAQQGGDVCEKPATCEVSNVTGSSATLTWTGGSGTYNVEVKGGEWTDWTAVLSNPTLTTTTLTLQPTTSYQARVQSVCDGTTPTSGWKSVSFTTPCDSYDIPYTYGFEDANPFACWTVISGTVSRQSNTTNTGSYRLDFRGTTSNMVALPQFNEVTNNLRVEFWTRPESTGGNSGKFAIGYMTDITDASTFVAVETYNSTQMTTTYVKKTVDFVNVPANANIAMRQFDCATNFYWYVDDVTVKEIPSCIAPSSLAANATTTSAELSWTANSSETAWTLYWKKTTDENYTEVANATNPYTLNDLTAATNYQYYVVANCSSTDASEASDVFNFATECAVIPALGYSENFETYTAGNNVLPTCWSYINTTTNSTYAAFPRVYANSANSAPNCLYFYSYYSSWTSYDPQPQYAILPEMDNLDGKQITLFAKGYYASSILKVGRMTDPTDTSTFTPCQELTLTTSYQEFEVELTGTGNYIALMIDAATSSRTTNGVYVDDITVENVPTCRKPSALMLDNSLAKTAHTATLKWTNGAEGQNAWQIAYSTDANFDPDTVTPIDFTTNPDTLEGLAQSTTYYAYVRANCGNGDYSAWNTTRASFTTLAGNNAPTGLAVDDITVSSNSATATWIANAANDLHQLYELYISTDATAPTAESTPTYTTNETSYTFTGLTPETEYFVWVRDNCGTDGYSAWVGSESFTTQASCPTPVLNAITEFTAHTADVEWSNFTENTNYEVSYRTAAYFDGVAEEFGTTPTDWTMYTGLLSNVMNGTALTSANYGWSFDSNNGVFDNHARVNIYGTSCNKWLVTPAHTVPENGALTFDMALTAFSGNLAAPGTNGTDDKFVVLITTDEMATWTVLREWNNSGSEYVYNNIPCSATGENVMIDLDAYVGQPVRIAFYGESTSQNADNNLHIDNVGVGVAVAAGEWQTQNVTENSLQLTNLEAETTYDVKVAGYCDAAVGGESDIQTFRTTVACPAPTNLEYVSESLTAHSVDLTWNVNDNPTISYELTLNDGENTVNNPITVNILNGIATYNLENLAGDKTYTVKVKANCGDLDGYSLESNEVSFTTPISCHVPTALNSTAQTTGSITVDWTNSIEEPTQWDIAYKDIEHDADYTPILNITEKPYTINGLTDGTTYSIMIRANCGDVDGHSQWSEPITQQTIASCATPGNVAVTDNSETAHGATITWTGESPNYQVEYGEASVFSFSESFDGGSMPAGWSTTSSNWSIIGDQNAGGSANEVELNWQPQIENGTTRLITPAFDLSGITSVTVSFKHMLDYYDGNYTRILGIATSSDDGTTWNTGWSQEFTNDVAATTISQVITTPDMGMSNVKFCIYFQGDSYGIDAWYFDDIQINGESLPTSWTVADDNVANNANAGTYTFDNLNPETTYYARVKGNCNGILSPASNIVGFTTLVACQAPTALTVGTPTHEQVVLSWTENGEATNWVVAYKAESETEYTELNVATNPYTLDGLDENTPYSVKVKADCGPTEGTSDWSNEETFTTLETCAAPTAFILDDVEAHQATFSWTAGNGNAAWKVYVKKHADAEYPTEYTSATTATATITNLVAATAYDVKIVPTCDESKTLEVENAFTTECEAVTISAEGWTENFDNYTGNSTNYYAPSGYPNHTMPTCWKFLNMSTNSSNYPQAFLSTNPGYPVSGNCLFFKSSSTTPIYAILPEFTNNTSDLAITFTYRNESTTSSNGTIIVGYMTDPYDDNTFEPVLTCDITNTLTTKTATFTGAPNGSYIAFKYQGSTSNYYASIDDVIVYVPTVIEKPIEANKWYAISSPVNAPALRDIANLVAENNEFAYDLYGYTEATGTWEKPTTSLTIGKGYIYRRSEGTTLQFVGIANTGNVPVSLTASCEDNDLKGFNLIGNPYPHTVAVSHDFYTLEPEGTWMAKTSGNTITAAEACLVQYIYSTTYTFSDETPTPSMSNTANSALAFTVSNDEFEDVAYARFDNGEGLRKIGHLNSEAPMLSIPVEGSRYAIANLGSDCQSFNLVFRGVNGTYTIKQSSNQAIAYCHLIDRVAGKDIDMLRQNYTFSSNGFDPDRFTVKLSPDAQENANGNFAYWNGNSWMVEGNGTLQVFDALGRQLFSQEISNSNFEIQNSLFPAAGVYVLRMGEKTQKIVVR